MSDLVSRLVDRGRGGAAASAALPLVQPLAAVYTPFSGEAGLVELDEHIASPALGGRADSPGQAPAIAQPGASKESPPRPEFEGSFPETADPVRAPAMPPAAMPPTASPGSAASRPPDDPAATETPTALSGAAAPPNVDGETRPAAAPSAPPTPVSPRAPMTLDQIAEAIFAEPPAPPRQPSWTPTVEAPPPPNDAGPVVSIGRIDILVAEPPAAAPGLEPPRTRGFQAYARLRRGLVR